VREAGRRTPGALPSYPPRIAVAHQARCLVIPPRIAVAHDARCRVIPPRIAVSQQARCLVITPRIAVAHQARAHLPVTYAPARAPHALLLLRPSLSHSALALTLTLTLSPNPKPEPEQACTCCWTHGIWNRDSTQKRHSITVRAYDVDWGRHGEQEEGY
jgi:hypothetical protein